jgi:hypothetical protein
MDTKLNKILVTNILKRLPRNVKTTSYLMDLLGLGRESVYRRIRGEVPFTVDELVKIATALDLSIDEIIGTSDRWDYNVFFDLPPVEFDDSAKVFQIMLYQLYNRLLITETTEVVMAINCFHPVFLVHFDTLFKFSYYQWLYQNYEIPLHPTFSKIVMTPELNALKELIRNSLHQLPQTILILDSNVFLNMIKEIHYYYQRKLITEEELAVLKKEVSELIDCYEKMAKTGVSGAHSLSIYLSVYQPIVTNTGLMNGENGYQSVFRLFSISHLIVNSPQICALQKVWLNFLKRQSICITQSNEIMQADFFNTQHKYIDMICKKDERFIDQVLYSGNLYVSL